MVIGTKQISRRGEKELEEEARQVTISRRKNQEKIKNNSGEERGCGFQDKLRSIFFFDKLH